ncbi:MAG: hypothetical protein U0T82_07560 [Bacteroidales bacterium]
MKQFLMILLAILPLALSAQRQDNMTPEARAKSQTDRFKTDLSLTTSQTDSVFIINLNYAYKMKALRDSVGFDPEAFRTLMEDKDKELKTVFTEEQFKKYQETRRERQFQPGQGRPGQENQNRQ